jgi:hypothetical protein
MMMTSNDNISNKSWQQRLGSPSSSASTQRINSTHFSQDIRSPISSRQYSLNEPISDSHFDLYSDHQLSPSTSFMNETHGKSFSIDILDSYFCIHLDDLSGLNMVERSQSAEDEKRTAIPSEISYKKDTSTPQFSSINTYRQQSTSATSTNDNLSLLVKTKKYSSQSVKDRKRKLYTRETDSKPFQSNSQGYFHKLMNCFRRTNIDRSKYENK